MLIINFEGREAKGLSKARYDETFASEDGFRSLVNIRDIINLSHQNMLSWEKTDFSDTVEIRW